VTCCDCFGGCSQDIGIAISDSFSHFIADVTSPYDFRDLHWHSWFALGWRLLQWTSVNHTWNVLWFPFPSLLVCHSYRLFRELNAKLLSSAGRGALQIRFGAFHVVASSPSSCFQPRPHKFQGLRCDEDWCRQLFRLVSTDAVAKEKPDVWLGWATLTLYVHLSENPNSPALVWNFLGLFEEAYHSWKAWRLVPSLDGPGWWDQPACRPRHKSGFWDL